MGCVSQICETMNTHEPICVVGRMLKSFIYLQFISCHVISFHFFSFHFINTLVHSPCFIWKQECLYHTRRPEVVLQSTLVWVVRVLAFYLCTRLLAQSVGSRPRTPLFVFEQMATAHASSLSYNKISNNDHACSRLYDNGFSLNASPSERPGLDQLLFDRSPAGAISCRTEVMDRLAREDDPVCRPSSAIRTENSRGGSARNHDASVLVSHTHLAPLPRDHTAHYHPVDTSGTRRSQNDRFHTAQELQCYYGAFRWIFCWQEAEERTRNAR